MNNLLTSCNTLAPTVPYNISFFILEKIRGSAYAEKWNDRHYDLDGHNSCMMCLEIFWSAENEFLMNLAPFTTVATILKILN